MKFNMINKRMTQTLLLLSVLFVGLVAPTTTTIVQNWESIAHADIASGESGSCTWKIDDDGVLTIGPKNGESGTLDTVHPWTGYSSNVLKVNIKSGVIANENSSDMFNGLEKCTEIKGLGNLNTSGVTDFADMFFSCQSLEELDLSNFDTTKAVNMRYMFGLCTALKNVDVGIFKTVNVVNMEGVFASCRALTQLDVSRFDTSSVTNMTKMFSGCSNLNQLDLRNFNTSKVTEMNEMFSGCSGLGELNISSFNTSQVTNMSFMFKDCSNLTQLIVSNFNTSEATMMYFMFDGCINLEELDVSKFNTSKVTTMGGMFQSCRKLHELDLSSFNTSQVTDMGRMFVYCEELLQLDLSNFDTSKVTSMNIMFSSCAALEKLDLSSFDTGKVMTGWMDKIFDSCPSLWKLTLGAAFKFELSGENGLQDPIVGNTFDTKYIVNSTEWQIVGDGNEHDPQGNKVLTSDIPSVHNNSQAAETYVWQGDSNTNKSVTFDYLDTDNADTVVDSEQLTGEEGTAYTVSNDKLDALKARGYEFNHAENGYPTGTYDSDKTINVYLKHGTTLTQTTKTVKQTIHYVDGTQKTLGPDNVQELTFIHSVTTDNVTGEILDDVWTPEQKTNAVTSPDVAGYTTTTQFVTGHAYDHTSATENVINVVYTANTPVPPVPPVPTPPTPGPGPTPAPIVGPNAVVVLPGVAPVITYAQVADTAQDQATTPATDDTITPPATDDTVVKSAKDADADKNVEAADTQVAQTAFWPWLWSLLAAAVLGLFGFLWYRRKHWIHYLETDDNQVKHYWANNRTPLGYFDKYFSTRIGEFEAHKHERLLNELQHEHPDFKVGDTVQVGNFKITAHGDDGQKVKYLDVVKVEK